MNNLDELIDSITEDAHKVKVAPRPLFVSGGWMMAIFLYVTMFIGFVGFREDLSVVMQQPLFVLELLLILITIVSTAIAASFGSFPDRARSAIATWAPMIPLALFAGLIAFNYFESMHTPQGNDMGHVKCVGWMCALSLLPGVGLFFLLSRGFCLSPRTAYTHAALAAAMTAYLVLRLEEAYVSPLHLIVMHIIPMIVLAFNNRRLKCQK